MASSCPAAAQRSVPSQRAVRDLRAPAGAWQACLRARGASAQEHDSQLPVRRKMSASQHALDRGSGAGGGLDTLHRHWKSLQEQPDWRHGTRHSAARLRAVVGSVTHLWHELHDAEILVPRAILLCRPPVRAALGPVGSFAGAIVPLRTPAPPSTTAGPPGGATVPRGPTAASGATAGPPAGTFVPVGAVATSTTAARPPIRAVSWGGLATPIWPMWVALLWLPVGRLVAFGLIDNARGVHVPLRCHAHWPR